MTVTRVRPLERDDLPEVLAIEAESNPTPWGTEEFGPFAAGSPPEAPGPRAWIVADPAVCGFLCAASAADEAELQSIAVSPWRRGNGLGSELMRAFLAWAASAGIRTVHLEVREGNAPARAFYARWGFAEAGRRPRYYRDGEAAVLMSRRLPDPA